MTTHLIKNKSGKTSEITTALIAVNLTGVKKGDVTKEYLEYLNTQAFKDFIESLSNNPPVDHTGGRLNPAQIDRNIRKGISIPCCCGKPGCWHIWITVNGDVMTGLEEPAPAPEPAPEPEGEPEGGGEDGGEKA